jgi:hypothetical protein
MAVASIRYNTVLKFSTAGMQTWTVPAGVDRVEVFLAGGGGGGGSGDGGGGGYTKTFRGTGYRKPSQGTWEGSFDSGRDGNCIKVTPGQAIQITVGAGAAQGIGVSSPPSGGFSQFMNSSYRAEGGETGTGVIVNGVIRGRNGGSGGGSYNVDSVPGSNGNNGGGPNPGLGQGHTTRDFGESAGEINAGAGGSGHGIFENKGGLGKSENAGLTGIGASGAVPSAGGGGLGGGGGSGAGYGGRGGAGGAGGVLVRFYDPEL